MPIANMENITYQNVSVKVPDFRWPLYLNVAMFIFGSLLVLINAILLYLMIQPGPLLKKKRFAFLVNMTFCDIVSGLVMIGLAITNVIGGDGPLVCILQGETCLNLCVTMSSYTCSVIVQFIAVKYPFYYKTNLTKSKIATMIAFCWIYAIGFSGIKLAYVMAVTHQSLSVENSSTFPYIEVVLKFAYLIFNIVCFAYVLIVTVISRRQRQVALRGNRNSLVVVEKEDDDGEQDIKKTNERSPLRQSMANVRFQIRHYEAILTSGLRLLVYLVTSLPLTVFCVYVLATNSMDAMNPGKVYGNSRDIGVSLVILWFCRALIDPLITLIREKLWLPHQTSSYNNSRRTTVTSVTSRGHSRYDRNKSYQPKTDHALLDVSEGIVSKRESAV